ncbi:MAG: hypothetical protein GY757_58415, partial [bacterium]|nr:hypothetical protein [bacterium]
PGDIRFTITREYIKLNRDLAEPENWRGQEVKTPGQKFQLLYDYYLNVMGRIEIDESQI